MSTPTSTVECIIPVLRVSNLARSVRFYTDVLGFGLDWKGETICSVSRDRCCLMLSEESRGNPGTWVWVGLQDESLFGVLEQKGVKILQQPKNRPWAYEMRIEDVDGNILWLGTETRKNEPIEDDVRQVPP